jgi:BMFP domain-containing protein YqiC
MKENQPGRQAMTSENPVLDQLAKLLTDAAGAAEGLRSEIDTFLKSRLEKLVGELNVVPREEFEAVKAMVAKAREENEALKTRIEELEKKVSSPPGAGQ